MLAKVRRWGNSYGVLLPKEIAEKNGIVVGDLVEIRLRRVLGIRELFGKYPVKNFQKVKEELKAGWE